MPKPGRILLCLIAIALCGFFSSCTEKSTEPEPARPAAPSNLVGAAIDTSRVSLSWQDNSTNEEGFQVYIWDGVQWSFISTTDSLTSRRLTAKLLCCIVVLLPQTA